jgi:hypothetical protein
MLRVVFCIWCAEIIEKVKLANLSLWEKAAKKQEKKWLDFILPILLCSTVLAIADYNVLFCRQETFISLVSLSMTELR